MRILEMVRLCRKFCAFQWLVALGLALLAGPMALAADYRIGPQPAWVAPRMLDSLTQPTQGQTLDGVHYLLVDRQTQLLPTGRTTFRRIASRALNGRGVESAAHISLDFDPSFQALTLHTLNVHREGRAQDRLHRTPIKVLQRETELEYRIYNGSKTVDIVLTDVRPDDIVEYAYSIQGTNPALVGKESGGLDMQRKSSVHHLYNRLLTPVGQALLFRSHLGNFQPSVSTNNGWTEYAWSATDVAPIAPPKNTPRWYDPYPYVAWTSFKDWASVARWAEPMYAMPQSLNAPLQKEIDRIASTEQTPQRRLTAVLDFVQSQIRYLGVEIGQGSYQPRSPQKVLQNRYGDCKDKVLLAITMLHALGIKAEPALVNTIRRHVIGDMLPTPNAFNHVILKAQIDGTDYWLDPTRATQKGTLHRLAQANFGKALVLDGQSQVLTDMPVTATSEYRRVISMDLDASTGYDQPATLTVSTVYDGVSADAMRGDLRNDNLEELQRNYLNFYIPYYPNMTVVKPFTVEDDEAANRLVTVEHYRVPTMLDTSTKSGKPVVYLYAPDMKAMLYRPDDTVRTAPFALKHPEDLSVTLKAILPHDRAIGASQTHVKDPSFEFDEATSYAAKTLQLNYHYRSLADHVTPENLPSFIANLEKARNVVGFTVRDPILKKPLVLNQWIGIAALLLALFLIFPTLFTAISVALGSRKTMTVTKKKTSKTLISTGVYLFWIPVLQGGLLAIVLIVFSQTEKWGGTEGTSNLMLGATCIFLPIYYFWCAIWRNRWLRWAWLRAQEPEHFIALAKHFKLPHQLPVDDIKTTASNPSAS